MRHAIFAVLASAAIATAAHFLTAALDLATGLRAMPAWSWQGGVVALVSAAILGWYAHRSAWPKAALWAGLFAITVGFQMVNLIEAVLFELATGRQITHMLLGLSIEMAALITCIVLLMPRAVPVAFGEREKARSFKWWSTRLAFAGLIYTIIYFTAGILVYPFVREFYRSESTPAIEVLVATQLLVRGPLLALIVALTVRIVQGTRTAHGVAGALLLFGFGAVVLLAPNPLLPADIRFVHFFEVGSSNALYGFLAGRTMSPGRVQSSLA